MSKVKIVDMAGGTGAVVVETYDVADTIRPWYPDAPTEVYDAIDELQDGLRRGHDVSGWAEYLGVAVTAAD